MALRDDLIPFVDEIRDEVVDDCAGLRLHTFSVVKRTWSGARLGLGTVTEETLVLDPVPKLMGPESQMWMAEAGLHERGDLAVRKISATYTKEQLADYTDTPLAANVEHYWLVDGQPFDVVSTEKRAFEWRVQLRRMRER